MGLFKMSEEIIDRFDACVIVSEFLSHFASGNGCGYWSISKVARRHQRLKGWIFINDILPNLRSHKFDANLCRPIILRFLMDSKPNTSGRKFSECGIKCRNRWSQRCDDFMAQIYPMLPMVRE